MPQSRLAPVAQRILQLAGHEPGDEQLLDTFRHSRDEQAFAALVRRHGPLVMGVCRRALGNEHDAEDAFQAAFLVLARCARSIKRRDSLAAWLHRVSHRIALNARLTLSRQRLKEQRGARPESAPAGDELTWGEVRGLLDEEVAKLPEAYRTVFVSCCLQDRSKPEVAKLLGLKEGTVSSRLARAKERLHEALTRRGVTLSALMATLALGQAKLGAAVLRATARVAVAYAAGASGVVPARVAALAAGETMLGTKVKMATALVLFVGMVLAPLAAQAPRGSEPDARAREAKSSRNEKQAGAVGERKEIEGRVLDPDGKPVKGATVAVRVSTPNWQAGATTVAAATTGADGRFRLAHAAKAYHSVTVVATAPGFGPQWATAGDEPLTLKLAKDHVVVGKVVDLEGRPVSSARLRVLRVMAPKDGSIESALAKYGPGDWPFRELDAQALPDRLQSARTDAKGMLRLAGLGHDRLIVAVIEGPTIASTAVQILNGPAAKPKTLAPVYLADFTHTAAPTRPVVGVVRDRKTRKPLAGVTVRSERLANQSWIGSRYVETKTDAAGKYRLVGMPTGRENWVVVEAPADQPYLALQLELPDPVGIDPLTLDVDLRLGIWAEGQVTVKETGQPAPHVQLQYFPLAGNPYLAEVVGGFRGRLHYTAHWTAEDGKYRLPVLPGDGAIVGYARGQYLTLWERPGVSRAKLERTVLQTDWAGDDLHYFAHISPEKDAARLRHDLTLWKGETLKVKLVDPEGKPVAGARSSRAANGVAQWEGPLPSAECVVGSINRKSPRRVEFVHLERNLAGVLKVPDDGTSDVVAQLRPAGTLVGQLVDDGGKPRPGVQMRAFSLDPALMKCPASQAGVRTGDRGEFRVAGLLPGVQYLIGPRDGASLGPFQLKEGETKDLGKVKQRR